MPLEDQDEVRRVSVDEMENLFDDHRKDTLNALRNFESKNLN
jgi:hypothetical protein